MWTRRRMLAGVGSVGFTGQASARSAPQSPSSLFSGDPALAENLVAKKFVPVEPGFRLPEAPLWDGRRIRRLSDLRGRPTLVALWSEWCAPCLLELPDLAQFKRSLGSTKVDIVTVLTASSRKLDYAEAQVVLEQHGASDLPLLIEPGGRETLLLGVTAHATLPTGSIPCTLLLDEKARLKARMFGGALLKDFKPSKPGILSEQDKQRLAASNLKTVWSTKDATTFAHALAAGALDRA